MSFRFKARAVQHSDLVSTKYAKWSNAIDLKVIAENRGGAYTKVLEVLGAPEHGKLWLVYIGDVEEIKDEA